MSKATGPHHNKQDFAYAGSPFIAADKCHYNWHEEFNTLIINCKDYLGLSGN